MQHKFYSSRITTDPPPASHFTRSRSQASRASRSSMASRQMASRQKNTRRRLLLLMLLVTKRDPAAAAAPLDLLPAPSALNASHEQSHEYHCNDLPSWTGGGPGSPVYQRGDCDQAVRMFEIDVANNPGRAQWLSLGFPHTVPGYGAPVWTPKRYTSGKSPIGPCLSG